MNLKNCQAVRLDAGKVGIKLAADRWNWKIMETKSVGIWEKFG